MNKLSNFSTSHHEIFGHESTPPPRFFGGFGHGFVTRGKTCAPPKKHTQTNKQTNETKQKTTTTKRSHQYALVNTPNLELCKFIQTLIFVFPLFLCTTSCTQISCKHVFMHDLIILVSLSLFQCSKNISEMSWELRKYFAAGHCTGISGIHLYHKRNQATTDVKQNDKQN